MMKISGSADDIARLTTLGEQIDDTIENLLYFIDSDDIFAKWNAALDALKAETGITFRYDNSPYHRDDISYDYPRLDSDGLTFDGFDRDHDRISFTLPFGFLSEETREDTLNTLRGEFTATAARQDHQRRALADQNRREAEAALTRAQADLDALNAQQA